MTDKEKLDAIYEIMDRSSAVGVNTADKFGFLKGILTAIYAIVVLSEDGE